MAAPMEISVKDLKRRLDDGEDLLILDVREPVELGIARIDGTLDIPMGEVPSRLHEIPDDKPLVVMCHHGMRSMQVTLWLRSNDFTEVSNLSGGIDAWARDIDPGLAKY